VNSGDLIVSGVAVKIGDVPVNSGNCGRHWQKAMVQGKGVATRWEWPVARQAAKGGLLSLKLSHRNSLCI
jgi:hypothetical protein